VLARAFVLPAYHHYGTVGGTTESETVQPSCRPYPASLRTFPGRSTSPGFHPRTLLTIRHESDEGIRTFRSRGGIVEA
jgi:hypothetical protein